MAEAAKNITPPTSAYQFEVSWRGLSGDHAQQARLLKAISPSALPQIFKIALSAPILIDIVKCLATFFAEEMDLVVQYLENLAKVSRFDMIIMCLSSADQAGLQPLLPPHQRRSVVETDSSYRADCSQIYRWKGTEKATQYEGGCRWIFSTFNSREFCETGKVIDGAYNGTKLRGTDQAVLSDSGTDKNKGISIPLKIMPAGQFEPLYRSTLSVQDGELPVLPLSVYGAVAMAHSEVSDEYSLPFQFFFYLYDKRNVSTVY